MAHKYVNRAWMTTATTGTGTVTLGSANSGEYYSFAEAGMSSGDTADYVILDGTDVEMGVGTYTSSGTTFSRDTVTSSRIGGTAGTSKKNLSGSATIFLTSSASEAQAVYDKLLNLAANSVLARSDTSAGAVSGVALAASQLLGRGSTGNVAAIALGKGLTMSGTTLTAGREVLTASKTIYVRTDGNDSNDGSADDAAHAFLTVQAAINAAYKIDSNGFDLIIKLADGTYATSGTTRNASFPKPFVGGKIILRGNTTTPANVNLTSASEHTIYVGSGAIVHIEGIKLASTSGVLLLVYGVGAEVTFDKMNFGPTTTNQIFVNGQNRVSPSGNYTVSGGASNHLAASDGAYINCVGRTVTFPAAINISTFVWTERNCSILVSGMTFTNKANVTGTRYWVAKNSIIDTGGGGASYLPGTAAGTAATGGQYL